MVSKVSQQTASIVPKFPLLYESPSVMSMRYKERVIQVLKESNRPLNVEEIRRMAGIGAWVTARNVVTMLLAEEKIEVALRLKKIVYYKIREESQSHG